MAMGINKYIYVMVNKRFDDSIRVSYTKTEIVDSVDEIQHNIIRECLKYVGITGGIEIVTVGDLPASSGLGSSSSVCVGTLNALYNHLGITKTRYGLARAACDIEVEILGNPIGYQDQYACAVGGFNLYTFLPGEVTVEPVELGDNNLRLYYTGMTRDTNHIIRGQEKQEDVLNNIKKICLEAKEKGPTSYKRLLQETWEEKRRLNNVSSGFIDRWVEQTGAGKLLGAGGGGFILSLDKPVPGLKEIEVDIDYSGSVII
jgi:D-glycero-alpha-D-manno-heptose-7-phosphate kinase